MKEERMSQIPKEELEAEVSRFKSDQILRGYYAALAEAQTARIPYFINQDGKYLLKFNEASTLETMVHQRIKDYIKEKYPFIEIV